MPNRRWDNIELHGGDVRGLDRPGPFNVIDFMQAVKRRESRQWPTDAASRRVFRQLGRLGYDGHEVGDGEITVTGVGAAAFNIRIAGDLDADGFTIARVDVRFRRRDDSEMTAHFDAHRAGIWLADRRPK